MRKMMTAGLLAISGVLAASMGCIAPPADEPIADEGVAAEVEEAAAEPTGEAADELSVCGGGLVCQWAFASGAPQCEQYPSGPRLYCCPSGYGLVNNTCVPKCGSGLQCSGSSIPGSHSCTQRDTGSSVIHCCESGQRISGGRCVW
ncbi:hypothetical protein [Sorangium cellulosum]|uniref:hypothetical protein n=1 Tax=Sorangium TaxID=39643 RepID=UPI0007791F57|nr:hypothetical protein [Sorangium cellulosum]